MLHGLPAVVVPIHLTLFGLWALQYPVLESTITDAQGLPAFVVPLQGVLANADKEIHTTDKINTNFFIMIIVLF